MSAECLDIFRERPELTLFRFHYPQARFQHFGVRDAGSGALGCGGAADPLEAQKRALFEWIERRVFRVGGESATSSGWAAHTGAPAARRAAALELIERDALLTSWLLRISPGVLDSAYFPAFDRHFSILQFGEGGDFVILGVLLESPAGRMLISTAAATHAEALAKLEVDSERARALLAGPRPPDEFGEHHRAFCELPSSELSWLHAGGEGLRYGHLEFSYREFRAPLWDGTEAFVAEATCDSLQPLYYGCGGLRTIRRERLRALRRPGQRLNRARHPIL